MMRNEFQVLVRATRRPMVKWWLRNGIWYLLTAALSIALLLWVWIYVPQHWKVWMQANPGDYDLIIKHRLLGLTRNQWVNLSFGMQMVSASLLALVWLLAASKVCALTNKLVEEHALPNICEFTRARYVLMLLQGLLPVALYIAVYIANVQVNSLVVYRVVVHSSDYAYTPFISGLTPMSFILPFIWILALMLVIGRQQYLVWLWAVPLVCFMPLVRGMEYMAKLLFIQLSPAHAYLFSFDFCWLIGLVISIAMLAFFANRKQLPGKILAGILIFSTLVLLVNQITGVLVKVPIDIESSPVMQFFLSVGKFHTTTFDELLNKVQTRHHFSHIIIFSWMSELIKSHPAYKYLFNYLYLLVTYILIYAVLIVPPQRMRSELTRQPEKTRD